MTDINALIAELRAAGETWMEWPRVAERMMRAADALAAQQAKINEALAVKPEPGRTLWYEEAGGWQYHEELVRRALTGEQGKTPCGARACTGCRTCGCPALGVAADEQAPSARPAPKETQSDWYFFGESEATS